MWLIANNVNIYQCKVVDITLSGPGNNRGEICKLQKEVPEVSSRCIHWIA